MSRCLIISQAYKKAIGLPVAAVILIDGGQVGATVLPSDRLCLFIQSAVCPPYPQQGCIHWIYSRQEGKDMLMMLRSPEEEQNISNPNFPHMYQIYQTGSLARAPSIC